MSLQSHLAELERRHQALERELETARTHPAFDELRLKELKRKKLQLKDEMERPARPDRVSLGALTPRFRRGATV